MRFTLVENGRKQKQERHYDLRLERVRAVAGPTGVVDIDVGAGAIDRETHTTSQYTLIDLTNPANVSGTITSVEIWMNTNATGVKVGTCYHVSGSTYHVRDSVLIGDVAAGSKKTFPVSLTIKEGDFIGMYSATGFMEFDNTGGGGIRVSTDDWMDIGDETTYTLSAGQAMSLYGKGTKIILL